MPGPQSGQQVSPAVPANGGGQWAGGGERCMAGGMLHMEPAAIRRASFCPHPPPCDWPQPRVGDACFANLLESIVGERWRPVNNGDPTPFVPPTPEEAASSTAVLNIIYSGLMDVFKLQTGGLTLGAAGVWAAGGWVGASRWWTGSANPERGPAACLAPLLSCRRLGHPTAQRAGWRSSAPGPRRLIRPTGGAASCGRCASTKHCHSSHRSTT